MKNFQDTDYRGDTDAFLMRCVDGAMSQAEYEIDLAEDELCDFTDPADDAE